MISGVEASVMMARSSGKRVFYATRALQVARLDRIAVRRAQNARPRCAFAAATGRRHAFRSAAGSG
jgi:hypothetical protein